MRTLKSETGAAFAEMAIIVPLLVLLVFGSIEMFRGLRQWTAISYLVREELRAGMIGIPKDSVARATALENDLIDRAKKTYGITLVDADITICPANNQSCSEENAGSSSEYFVIIVSKAFNFGPIALKNSLLNIKVSGMIQNEPYF